jgi:hypothetical protein
VADVISTKCLACHGSPQANQAPMPLVTRDDFLKPSMLDPSVSVAERCLVRMQMPGSPMPPQSWPVVSDAERATFAAWVDAGLPTGTCETHQDAGPGPVTLTCASGVFLPAPSTSNPHGSVNMAPGNACISCHAGHNFENQNPGSGLERLDQVFEVMGTVFPALHEENLCASAAGDGGTVVEIFDSTGALAITAPVNAGGNFYASSDGGLKMPFTARIVRGASVSAMIGAQSQGDCNTCHTPFGEQGAPGRIVVP